MKQHVVCIEEFGIFVQVWKGEDIITHQPVAMKFLNKQGSTPQQTAALQNDIFKEVKALTAVDHPNIMKLQGAFYIGNYICLVSELADGESSATCSHRIRSDIWQDIESPTQLRCKEWQ